jgi:hypothetical protein
MNSDPGSDATSTVRPAAAVGTVLIPRTHEEFAISISDRQWKALKKRIRTAGTAGTWDAFLLAISTTLLGVGITTLYAYLQLPIGTQKDRSLANAVTPLASDVALIVGLAALILSATTLFFWWRMSSWRKGTLIQIVDDMDNYEPPTINGGDNDAQTHVQ